MRPETVLVTGGAGAIGSRLVRALARQHRVIVVDDLSSGYMENLRGISVELCRGSIVDDELLAEAFAERPSVVFHLAANFANQNSVDHPQRDLLVNGLGTLKVLEHSRRADVRNFVYASSSSVYGASNAPLAEGARDFSSATPYALTKRLGEHYVDLYRARYGLPTVTLRLFNSYGPGEYPGRYRNVIPNFLHRAIKGLPLVITGSGDETRDFTYVDDVVEVFQLAMRTDAAVGRTLNVGSGTETAIRALAELVREVCRSNVPVEFQPRRSWDAVARRCADISLLRMTLGYTPRVELRDGLERTYAWLVENRVAAYRSD